MDGSSDQPSFVLHCDVDAFFVQIEQLKDPSLQGKAVAIQQHQDIIAANAAAKAAGVTKHMNPAEARRLLRAVGGRVAHVHCAAGGRVSYQPYREASARMMKLLKALPWAAVVEKASIDEAFILLSPANPADMPGLGSDGDAAGAPAAEVALQRAHEVKAAVKRQLGLTVSVGAAPNRLLAKLASAAAKPDGIRLVPDQAAALQLLSHTPARRLPGYGGKAAEAFERHGIQAATDLQRYSQADMEQLFGLKPASAAQLAQWCHGLDSTPVQEKPPPKTLSVQMSLTPQLLAMHPSHGTEVSASGGRAGVLEPLVTGKPDFRLRVRQLMTAMGLDLLERVREDAAEESRWPKTLSASLRAFGAGRDQAFTTRSGAFPSQGLAQQRQQAQQPAQQAQEQQAQAQQQQQPPQLSALEEAVVHGLEQLLHQAAATYPPTATVVELRLAATNFTSAAAAAAAAPITRFFSAAARLRQGQQEQQAQQGQQGQQGLEERGEQQAGDDRSAAGRQERDAQSQQAAEPAGPQLPAPLHLPASSAGSEQQQQRPAQPPAQAPQQPTDQPWQQQQQQQRQHAERPGDEVDLDSIDVREQQRILQQLERQRQQPHRATGGRGAGGRGGGGKRRGAAAPREPDAKQRKIMSFFTK